MPMLLEDTRGRLASFYSDDQPRVPAGSSDGGQWAAGTGSTHEQPWAAPVRNYLAKTEPPTPAETSALANHLRSLTTEQLRGLRADHGVAASASSKAVLVGKLREKFAEARAKQATAQPEAKVPDFRKSGNDASESAPVQSAAPPKLYGTEKQIAYADSVRSRVLRDAEKYVAHREATGHPDAAKDRAALGLLKQEASSRYWIDGRNDGIGDHLESMRNMHAPFSADDNRGRLVAVFADEMDGRWVTMDGTHVFIGKSGSVEKGPPNLVGKKPEGDAKSVPLHHVVARKLDAGDKAGALDAFRSMNHKPDAARKAFSKLSEYHKAKLDEADKEDAARPSAKPVANPEKTPTDLKSFAARAQAAADKTKTGGYGHNKVFISHVYQTMRQTDPGLTLADFKEKLLDANNAGHLTLSRADLVEDMRRKDVDESETNHPSGFGQFHFILSHGERERSRPNDQENREYWKQAAAEHEEKERSRHAPFSADDDNRGRLAAVFAEDDDAGGHWITIGAEDHEGGTPVFIKDGVITKGPADLTNRRIDNLKAPPEIERPKEPGEGASKEEWKAYKDKLAGVHRAELNQSKESARKEWGNKAKEIGHKPEHLHALAAEMRTHDKAAVDDRLAMLQDARKQLKNYGYDARTIAANSGNASVGDWTKIPHFDSVAQSMAWSHPGQFSGHASTDADAEQTGNAPERLWDLLLDGNPRPMHEEEAYRQALDELSRHAPEKVSRARGDAYEGRSSGKRPSAAVEDVPFADDGRGRLAAFYDEDEAREPAGGAGGGRWTAGGGNHPEVQAILDSGKHSTERPEWHGVMVQAMNEAAHTPQEELGRKIEAMNWTQGDKYKESNPEHRSASAKRTGYANVYNARVDAEKKAAKAAKRAAPTSYQAAPLSKPLEQHTAAEYRAKIADEAAKASEKGVRLAVGSATGGKIYGKGGIKSINNEMRLYDGTRGGKEQWLHTLDQSYNDVAKQIGLPTMNQHFDAVNGVNALAAPEKPKPIANPFDSFKKAPAPQGQLFEPRATDTRPDPNARDKSLRDLSAVQKRSADWDMPQIDRKYGGATITHLPSGHKIETTAMGDEYMVKDAAGKKVGQFKDAKDAADYIEKQAGKSEPSASGLAPVTQTTRGKLFDFSADGVEDNRGRLVEAFNS